MSYEYFSCEFEDCGRKAISIRVRDGLLVCSLHDESTGSTGNTGCRLAQIVSNEEMALLIQQDIARFDDEFALHNQVEVVLRGIHDWLR